MERAPVIGVRLRLHVLGPFTALRGGTALSAAEVGSRKERLLLQLLLADEGRVVSSDRAAEVLWGEDPPARPHRAIATLVSRLRKLLGPEAIAGGPAGYRFVASPVIEVDLVEARRLVDEAEVRLAEGQAAVALAAAEQALGLLSRGIPFEDERYADWAEGARGEARSLTARARRCAGRAAVALSDFDAAARWAEAAIAADELDEAAHRALMLARHRAGEGGRALEAYDRLRSILAEALGTDPSAESRALHTAILRDEVEAAGPSATPFAGPKVEAAPAGFVGRDGELSALDRTWAEAVAGRPSMLVIDGEAGIGKTSLAGRLVDGAGATGGTVLVARCYQAERSLLLQPVADAIRSVLGSTPPEVLREAAGEWSATLAELVPDLGPILRPFAQQRAAPEVERHRTFEATTAFLRALVSRRPVLLFLDDLHNAGVSTLELLHVVHRRITVGRLMILATVRSEEADQVRAYLGEMATWMGLEGLPRPAVEELARRSGVAAMAARIADRTRGHTLFVVETLRAIQRQGSTGVEGAPLPDSLRDAVVARVQALGADVEEFLRSAATMGWAFDPDLVARLMDIGSVEAGRRALAARRGRLVVEAGASFEFANELIRDILYETTPGPIRIARHRRAASLLVDNPEAAAGHAAAAGDWPAAVDAWLRAADAAAARYANTDADRMLGQALEAARAADDPRAEARVRVARGTLREALPDYWGAYGDLWGAIERARVAGDREIEMRALRALGGDVLVGLGRPTADCLPYLHAALAIAGELGDVDVQVVTLERTAIIWANRLRFDLAYEQARRGLAMARERGDEGMIARALDGVKSAAAYSGDLVTLESVLPELQAILRRQGERWRLQWAMFEASFPPMARGQWDRAEHRVREALELNRRSGYRQNTPMFLPQLAWIARKRGEYGRALILAREAVALATEVSHPWATALASLQLGTILVELYDVPAGGDALEVALRAAERDGAESYLVRCLGRAANSALRGGRRDLAVERVQRSLAIIDQARTPTGSAFLLGAEAYVDVALARLGLGDPAGGADLAARVMGEARAAGWTEPAGWAALAAGRCRATVGDERGAASSFEDALAVADDCAVPALRWKAFAGLASVDPVRRRRAGHRRSAAAVVEQLAASIDDPALRRRFEEGAREELGESEASPVVSVRAARRSARPPEPRRPSPRRGN
jgi:DNA-binding SARP family transcriptional activator